MRVAISLLEHTFRLARLFLFPAVAVWAWRVSGSARLWLSTGIGLGLIGLLAVFTASATGGNALAPVYGYGYAAPRFGLYVVGVLCAGLAWVVAVIVGVNILAAVAERWPGVSPSLFGVG